MLAYSRPPGKVLSLRLSVDVPLDAMVDQAFQLPADPTDDDLASDWTLRAPDLGEVRRCDGEEKRRFALQLCMVRPDPRLSYVHLL